MPAASSAFSQDHRIGRLQTDLGKDAILLLGMYAVERLSEAFTITVDAFSEMPQPLHSILGTNVAITFDSDSATHANRFFNGELWEYTELDGDERGYYYRLVLKPKMQFMALNRRNRIFQNKTVVDIVKDVLIGDRRLSLSGAYDVLEYCVQYQESDFDFVSRMLEYEGIYYHYEHAQDKHVIVLVDDRNAHAELATEAVRVLPRESRRSMPYFWSVSERRGVGPAKVTVADYDFQSPSTPLLTTHAAEAVLGNPAMRQNSQAAGAPGAWAATSELYDFPARFDSKQAETGQRYSKVWLEAHRRRMARSFAEGTLFSAAVGKLVTIDFEKTDKQTEYLIVGTTHRYTAPPYHSREGGEEKLVVELELMPASEQYRPALRTPRPRILGPQTALVVGPAGEEIHTDKHGRIKVQFFWDREGKKDQASSCFIRVVQSGAGQGWGSFSLPRIGQEVVVEFMDGDPDRPIVTGAVYNGTNTPPAALPDNKTQYGMKSRITKGGGGFNRLWFDDKKGSEVVWFRAERDYKVNIVNKDEERQYDEGDRKTTFMKGNDELVIKQGFLKTTLETGDETRTLTQGKRTTTIQQDETLEIKMGNRDTKISMGNDTLKVSVGNVGIKVDLGSHKTEAMQSIELKCGPSTLKLDPMSISLEAMTIKLKAQMMVQVEGLMIENKASAIQIVKGGLVLIN